MSSSQSPIAQAAAVMRALALLIVLWLASPAQAAAVRVVSNGSGQSIVVDGPITFGDIEAFARAVDEIKEKGSAVVILTSAGGSGGAGILMGDLVRRSGMNTFVPNEGTCGSACAMIWIAGVQRTAGKNACIGFHGMYDPASGQPNATMNALAGTHLGLLGLSLDAAYWMLSPRQLDTHWLNDEAAQKYGIFWSHDTDDGPQVCPKSKPMVENRSPSPPTPSSPPPPPQPGYRYTFAVMQNLNLRELPDPRSANLLTPWAPEDFISTGVTFSWREEPTCNPGPTGYVWCRVTFRHHNTETTGWVAAYYLWSATDNKRVACLYPSPDPDCRRQP